MFYYLTVSFQTFNRIERKLYLFFLYNAVTIKLYQNNKFIILKLKIILLFIERIFEISLLLSANN